MQKQTPIKRGCRNQTPFLFYKKVLNFAVMIAFIPTSFKHISDIIRVPILSILIRNNGR